MELVIVGVVAFAVAVLAVAGVVAGTVWTMHGLKLIRDFKADADLKRRVLDLEIAAHDMMKYVDDKFAGRPTGPQGSLPPHIPGKDPEIDGHGSEVYAGQGMGPGELEDAR